MVTGPVKELRTVLRVCEERNENPYTTKAAVLAGYAESDFRVDATQDALESDDVSIGVFQQIPKWWPSARQGTDAQCRAFLDAFMVKRMQGKHNGDIVHDLWTVQQWYPSDHYDPNSPETMNYTRRLPVIDWIIANKRLP